MSSTISRFGEGPVRQAGVGIQRPVERGVVVGAAGDRLVEDSRVARDTAQTVVVDQSLQSTARDQAAADVVQPDELATFIQSEEWVHRELCSACIHVERFCPRRGVDR